jgi:hypothetical protein
VGVLVFAEPESGMTCRMLVGLVSLWVGG